MWLEQQAEVSISMGGSGALRGRGWRSLLNHQKRLILAMLTNEDRIMKALDMTMITALIIYVATLMLKACGILHIPGLVIGIAAFFTIIVVGAWALVDDMAESEITNK